MAANIVPEEVAPLLEKEDLESDVVAKGPEIQVDATTVSSGDSVGPTHERRACDFLIRRSTYYWTALIAQFCHMTTCSIGFGFSVAQSDRGTPTNRAYAAVHRSGTAFLLLVIVLSSENPLVFNDPVRPVVTPLSIGSAFVAAIACMKAARITRLSALKARGTELVNDPERRVPAWYLATTDECAESSIV
ncbi:hypothetical protein CVT25_009743 [Psilocybe cyanescens]|uniref:Uncharacterized protein n=1 Tax=Psilocybe cyanescens TaxID=93625 RepID=A0A409XTR6_PSICY|nr:hypothetical protein CVT25_009743 [Psilocybe cyanescens]